MVWNALLYQSCLDNQMDPKFNFPQLYFENIIRSNKEMKFL